MKKRIESAYGRTLRSIMMAVNPVKKIIINTHCMTHKYINSKSIALLEKEGFVEQHNFYKKHLKDINLGVTWADQDFKSSNHFYHFITGKGLYGFSNALQECRKYYKEANTFLELGDMKNAMFYFGAACHLIQDSTVPQHANNKLLKHHRKFELWIISKIAMGHHFEAEEGIKIYRSTDEYIKNNTLMANKTYLKYAHTRDIDDRYMKIATIIVKEAQMATAGFMLDFYEKLKNKIEYIPE